MLIKLKGRLKTHLPRNIPILIPNFFYSQFLYTLLSSVPNNLVFNCMSYYYLLIVLFMSTLNLHIDNELIKGSYCFALKTLELAIY